MSDLRGNQVIDSREVMERIEELQDERNGIMEHSAEVESGEDLANWDKEFGQELTELKELAEEGESASSDWTHGVNLIRDDYFTDYVQEMLADIGELPRDIPHYIVIDWDETASNIQADYTSIEFGGETYWFR